MRFLAVALVLVVFSGCEKKPTEEEIEQKRAAEVIKRSPTPKPGEWMWKNRNNPLEKKP